MIVGQQDSMSLTSAGTRKRRVEPKWREKERAVFIAALACGSQRSGIQLIAAHCPHSLYSLRFAGDTLSQKVQ